jgi:hypothetical protein
MPCIGPIHFFLDGVCFLDAGLGLALGSGTTLLGTGEVEVGAHDVDETGGEAPNGPRTTAIRATLNPNTRRRTDRGGGHGRGAWGGGDSGEGPKVHGQGRVVGPTGTEVGRYGVGDKSITFFGRNALRIVISMVIPPFCHHATLRVGPV